MKQIFFVLKRLRFLLISSAIVFLIGTINVYFFGANVDTLALRKVDTRVFENYQKFDYEIDQNKGTIKIVFSSFDKKNKVLSKNVTVYVEIYGDDIFSKDGTVSNKVIKNVDNSYTNLVSVEKNNVKISGIEQTDLKNSKQLFSEISYVISQFEKAM